MFLIVLFLSGSFSIAAKAENIYVQLSYYINFFFILSSFRGNMVDAFRMHIMQTKELGTCPVRQIGGCSFFYMRISNVYIVIVVSSNANVACAFKFVVEVIL